MKTDNYTKQAQINEMDGGNVSVHHLLTADEFIAQMEPRIRSMFKWNSFELKKSQKYLTKNIIITNFFV